MGYNIEISFNVSKNGSATKLLEEVIKDAEECSCESIYEDYEFENNVQFQRRHCLITVSFAELNVNNMIEFLNRIKKNNTLYIETIYDEEKNMLLYASQYYITQKMDKNVSKKFKMLTKNRVYSVEETNILKSVLK